MKSIGSQGGHFICEHAPEVSHWPSNGSCGNADAVYFWFSKVCVLGRGYKPKPLKDSDFMMIKGDPRGPIRPRADSVPGENAEPADSHGMYRRVTEDEDNIPRYAAISSFKENIVATSVKLFKGSKVDDEYKDVFDCANRTAKTSIHGQFSKVKRGTIRDAILRWSCTEEQLSRARHVPDEGFTYLVSDVDRDFYGKRASMAGSFVTLEIRFFRRVEDPNQYGYFITYNCRDKTWAEGSFSESNHDSAHWAAIPSGKNFKQFEVELACDLR